MAEVGKKVLEIKNISKTFDRQKIIDNVSLTVYSSEIFGFLGPNGAGKTTTIKMMVGLIPLDQGDILINGYSIKKNFEQAMQNVGAIVENPDLYENMTGYENLKLIARLYRVKKERINEIVKQVGLEDKIQYKVKKYSMGMKQRLAIALALLRTPQLLILDEPTNGLDPSGIHELRDLLKDLAHNKGICVFVSSHLLSEVEIMCDKVGILNKGKLLKVESLNEMISDADNLQDKATYRILTTNNHEAKEILKKEGYEVYEEKEVLNITIEKTKIASIIKKLSENDVVTYEISIKKKTLEEEFLKITNGGEMNE
ncbi:MAG: ABC transporter ATP-binding protein [Clostridia bacterium]|nr:ABC transporter ATP-binding protein [Clostridia bacterium]